MKSLSRSEALHPWYIRTATVLAVALVAWATGVPRTLFFANAAQLQQFSDTLSTSRPGLPSDHTMRFTTPSGVAADGSTIVITMPSGFDVSALGEDDIDVADDGVDLTTAPTCGATQAAVSTSTQTITITVCSGGGGAIASGSVVTIEVGTHATSSGAGVHQIVNHASAGSYELNIATPSDTGSTELIVVDAVTVSGQVDMYLDFSVDGVNAGQAVNADATLTFATTTATSVAFGTVAPDTAYVLAQDLAVTTNAVGGFTVTVEAAGNLQSLGGATIDPFVDGTGTSTPIVWAAPSSTVGLPDTYGHWGVTTEDTTLSDNDSFGNALYVGDFVDEPREVMYATSSADGSTPDVGTTRIGYRLEISAMQEAARDYTTSLTYVVTPVF